MTTAEVSKCWDAQLPLPSRSYDGAVVISISTVAEAICPLRGSLPRGEIVESGAWDLLMSESERKMQLFQRQVSARKQNHPNGTFRAITQKLFSIGQ